MANATEYEIQLHKRLLEKDETASSELLLNFSQPIVEHLKKLYYHDSRCTDEFIHDIVIDTLLDFIDSPDKFNPGRGALKYYLKMSVEGDLKNKLKKKKRDSKFSEKNVGDVVELDILSRNSIEESVKDPEQILMEKETDQQLQELDKQLKLLFADEKDYEIANLILSNVRETRRYADILKITHLSMAEQREQVKRVKDRIKKKLERTNFKRIMD